MADIQITKCEMVGFCASLVLNQTARISFFKKPGLLYIQIYENNR